MKIITPSDVRPDINTYLTGWYEKAKARQEAKGKRFLISYGDFLNLWGMRRLRKLAEWMDDGSLYVRQRKHTKDNPNPNGYVLTPIDFAASQANELTPENMTITTRGQSLQNCKMKKGDKHSAKSRGKISQSTTGVPKSDSHRQNISESMKGKNTGPMSEEGKAARSAAMKAYWERRRAAAA